METKLTSRGATDIHVDLLVVGTGPDWKSGEVGHLDERLRGKLIAEVRQQGFTGAPGEVALFQTHGALLARYVLVVGVGSNPDAHSWYRLADACVAHARTLKASSAAVVVPRERGSAAVWETIVEGAYLSNYTFDRLKSTKEPPRATLQQLSLLESDGDASVRAAFTRARTVAAATCYARDLINLPAAVVTPTYLADEAKRIARQQQLRLRVLDERAIKRAGMGAILGVAQGSSQPPRFIELVYEPRLKVRRQSRPAAGALSAAKSDKPRVVALAGKGITFDSGGLSIKSAEAMQAQKRDMAGGAAVLAVMSVARDLGLPVEVRGYVAATENMPGGRAIKPGDVVRAFNGTSIEVLNTDAEGRLVLADALSFAGAAKPDALIDLATLTGAVRTALGDRYAAIMGTDPTLVHALIAAGRDVGENLWELPLVSEYRADIESAVADIKNIGSGGAGTIIGGLFLREFVGAIPWAHIDFSSTVMTEKALPGLPRGATGFGVRTLLRYLRGL
jgi:leucyl aminopeptidase